MKLVPISLFLVLTFISVACNLNREHSSGKIIAIDIRGAELISTLEQLLP